jgi:hypothetical protein
MFLVLLMLLISLRVLMFLVILHNNPSLIHLHQYIIIGVEKPGPPIRSLATQSMLFASIVRALDVCNTLEALTLQLWLMRGVFDFAFYEVYILPPDNLADVTFGVRESIAFKNHHVGVFAGVPNDPDGAHF